MEHTIGQIRDAVRIHTDRLFDLACDIFDHPELALGEFYAAQRLTTFLEQEGFAVERGTGGLETAFRAVWKRGVGGPVIGMMLEYDALEGVGHACGHHLQGPACIGAALAFRKLVDTDCSLVLYGTPAEEGVSGKVTMAAAGCFRDVDIMFCFHAGVSSGVGYSNKALQRLEVAFHGVSSHASTQPHLGRSALDAALLMFHALEIMREHITDGSRIHYSLMQGTGPSNIIPDYTAVELRLRSGERKYVAEMTGRVRNIVEGACLMTGTTAEVKDRGSTENMVTPPTLLKLLLDNEEALGLEKLWRHQSTSGGSSDVGNVSHIVPLANIYTWFCDGRIHSEDWAKEGKTPNARRSMETGAEVIAMTALQMVNNPQMLEQIKAELKHILDTE